MKTIRNAALIVALWSVAATAFAAVDARLDRDQVSAGESVELSLRYDGSGGGQPDLSPLKQDFDVLGTSSGSSISIVNGHIARLHEVRVTLSPRHGGSIAIPPLTWSGEQSAALRLTVADASAGTGGAADAAGKSPHVFLTATLDDPHPYVQSSVVLTVQVHTDLPLYQAGLEISGNDDVLVQQIGQDRQTRETRDGHAFDMVERQYLLQPQRSGVLELPGATLDAQVPDTSGRGGLENDPFFGNALQGRPFGGMASRTRPIRLHGDTLRLDTRPRPAGADGPVWLPAKKLTLAQTFKPETTRVRAGEPLSLHLVMTAQGLTAEQLPDLSRQLSLPEGVKAYPDQAKLNTVLQGGEILGSREQDIALIASKPGRYRLPALHLQWWDTQTDAQREVVLPERTIEVLPAPGGAAAPESPAAADAIPATTPRPTGALVQSAPAMDSAADNHRSPWPWISLALGLLWLTTVLAWWLRKRSARRKTPDQARNFASTREEPDAAVARDAFRQACRQDDAPTARRQLLAWARATDRSNPPAGLNALALRLNQPALTGLLNELDRACYSGSSWKGDALASALTVLPGQTKAGDDKQTLAGLYP